MHESAVAGEAVTGAGEAAPAGTEPSGRGGTDEPAGGSPVDRARRFADWAYWLWPALFTLVLTQWRLGTPTMWADELATWGAVRLRWSALFRLAGNVDAVVTPYLVVEKAWVSLAGTSTFALRLPSVLAMTASAALVTVLGNRLAGRRVGLLAGVIFALVPATSRFGQEARPYGFAVFFAVLATLLLLRYAHRPGVRTGLPYALAVALLGAFHLIGLLLLLAHAVVIRRRLVGWAFWAGLGVLPLLPLAWLGHRQSGQLSWIPAAHLHTILAAPDGMFGAAVIGGALIALGLLSFSVRDNGFSPRGSAGSRPGDGLSAGSAGLLLACWALVPVLALAAIAQLTPLFWPRYLLYTVPAWVLAAALTLGRVPRFRAVIVVLAIAALGLPTQTAIRLPDGHGQGTSQAAAVVAANYRPGDAIAYSQQETAPWVARDLISRYLPASRTPQDIFAVAGQRVDGHLAAPECADLTACLDRADPARLWFIRLHAPADPLDGIGVAKETLLRDRYHLDQRWSVRDLTVALYVRD